MAETTQAKSDRWRVDSAGEVFAVLGLFGLAVFVVCYSYARAFYNVFGLEPETGGQGYAVVLARVASGGLLFVALLAAAAVGPMVVVTLQRTSRLPTRPVIRRMLAMAVAAAAAFVVALAGFTAAGESEGAPFGVAASFAVLAAALALVGPSQPSGLPPLLSGRVRAFLAVAVVLLVVARAWDTGGEDARSLLRAGDARSHASLWQQWLGLPTPAATARWTEPGTSTAFEAPVRLLGVDGDFTVLFDLEMCALRRLPSGAVSTSSGVAGHRLTEGPAVTSELPRCPRD